MENQNDTEQVLKKVGSVLEKYSKNGLNMGIGDLLTTNDVLVGYMYYLGEISADLNRDFAVKYFNRKMVRGDVIQRMLVGDQRITVAESTADTFIKKEKDQEIEASHLAERVDNILNAISKTIDALSRRITHLRDEQKRSEYQPKV